MSLNNVIAKEFEISGKDVTNYRDKLKDHATKLHAAGNLHSDNLSAYLQVIIAKERDMDLNVESTFHHYFLTDCAMTSIGCLVQEVKGPDGNLVTMENVFQFLESTNDHVYCVDRRQTNEGYKQVGLCVFTKSGIKRYVRYHAVIEIDSTFKKNDDGYPLVIIVGLDGNRKVFIIGFALIHDSTTLSYMFVLNSMKLKLVDNNKQPIVPSTIFTDEEDAALNAVKSVYPTTVTFRCDWHLQKNVQQKTSYPKNPILYKHGEKIRSLFWLCKLALTEQDFQVKWDELKVYIETIPNNDAVIKFKEEMTAYFLIYLPTSVNRWADYFRHKVFHMGVRTTQAVECMNSLLSKRGVNGTKSVGFMIKELFDIMERQNFQDQKKNCTDSKKLPKERAIAQSVVVFTDIIHYIKNCMTDHACELQINQIIESSMYEVVKWENDYILQQRFTRQTRCEYWQRYNCHNSKRE